MELTRHGEFLYHCENHFTSDQEIFDGSKVLTETGGFKDVDEWSNKYAKKVSYCIQRGLRVEQVKVPGGIGYALFWNDNTIGFSGSKSQRKVA